MPDSDRGRLFTAVTAFVVATVVVLTGLAIWDGAASYTQHRLEAEHYAAEYASESQERIEHCAALAASADIAECISQVVGATREHQRGERDLATQRDMAKWAGWLLVASGTGVWITLAGVIYVALTLKATREAVAAANRTADEAKRIGEAQVRAYMSVGDISIIFGADEEKIIPIIQMKIRNSGNSPARSFEMHMQLAYQAIVFDGVIAQEVFLIPENWGPFVSNDERPFSFAFREGLLGQKYIEGMQQRDWPLGVHVTINTSFVDVFDKTFKESQTFTALYGTLEEIYQRRIMNGSPTSIDERVESAKYMTVKRPN